MTAASLESGPAEDPGEGSTAAAAVGRVFGPLLAAAAVLLTHPAAMGWGPLGAEASWTLGVLVLMAVWWVTLAVEPAVTGLIPFVAFALLGIGRPAEIAAPYANDVIFLFAGGALIGLALERTGVSARFAAGLIALAGRSPLRVLTAMMIATALLSAFVSNVATAATMLPLAMALGSSASASGETDEQRKAAQRFFTSLLLGVAFAASIGGTLTIIGTAPNAIAAEWLRSNGEPIDFIDWMKFSVPAVAIFLPLSIVVLGVVLFPARGLSVAPLAQASKSIDRDGWLAVAVFFVAVLAWVTRPLYAVVFPVVTDGVVAIAAAVALFVLPSRSAPTARILESEAFTRVPWRVLVLFGGGLCLADAMQRTGLSDALGGLLGGVGVLPSVVLLAMLVAAVVFASEVASNTTLTAMAVPIVGALASGLGVDAQTLVIPAAFAASWSFALPVGTPPNALVYGTGMLRVQDMMRAGFVLDLLSIVVIVAMATLLL